MALLKIKKCGLFVPLVAIAIVLSFHSVTWSQPFPGDRVRYHSSTADIYILQLSLNYDAWVAARTYVMDLNPSWVAHPIAYVILRDRHNFRNQYGQIVGTGDSMETQFMLVVQEPSTGLLTFLIVKSFNSNQAIIDYSISYGIAPPGTLAREIKSTHEAEREEGVCKVKSRFKVLDGEETITFRAEWEQPAPTHFPPDSLPPGEFVVVPFPFAVRFVYAPERLFERANQRTIYQPALADIFLELDINLSDSLGVIFNNANVEWLRFNHSIETVDEIITIP